MWHALHLCSPYSLTVITRDSFPSVFKDSFTKSVLCISILFHVRAEYTYVENNNNNNSIRLSSGDRSCRVFTRFFFDRIADRSIKLADNREQPCVYMFTMPVHHWKYTEML